MTEYGFLMFSTESTFADFEKERRENTGSAMLSYAFTMRPTLECALFPDLFPFSFWCDKVVQVGSHLSVKESLCAKMSSAMIDYAADHRLHQYHCRQVAVEHCNSRITFVVTDIMTLNFSLSVKWFSSKYMVNVAAAVTDIVKTIGATHVVLDVRASRMDVSIAHGCGKYIDAGKCAGRVFCGRYCCRQRRARYVRVDQGIPDGKELPKAIEVEKPLLSTVPAFVVRPELQKGTSWDSQGRVAWHWHVLGLDGWFT